MKKILVAIDGFAGSGKSTVARMLAEKLGVVAIDTGAMYRLVAYRALQEGVPLDNEAGLKALAEEVAKHCTLNERGELCFRGRPVGSEIRTPDVSEAASAVSAHPLVRKVLVHLQRTLVPPRGAVMEGRDIGTVVLPGADLKVFLTASEETRAARHAGKLGGVVSAEEMVKLHRARDRRDSTRAASPLQTAKDAFVLDSSGQSPEETVAEILKHLPHASD